jgi:hypothetical protein
MKTKLDTLPAGALALGLFALSQVAVMLVAISDESLWIDEFWTAHFAALPSLQALIDLILVPSGSQTPLHFLHFFLWGRVFDLGELTLRLANLPVFLLGQLSLYLALRPYPRAWAWLVLALGALHPMVWQYANEARPYIMIIAGSQMILAYLLHLHARLPDGPQAGPPVSLGFTAMFVAGGILLFGASLLGAFWVFSAVVYAAYLHHRSLGWRYLARGFSLALVLLFLASTAVLTVYYVNNVLSGGGGSRLATTTPATMAFSAYELLGLSGLGPSRHDLRDGGLAALVPYAPVLAVALALLLYALVRGVREARARLVWADWLLVVVLAVLPVAVVIFSGFAMHWRVLGRHLLATLPLLNLLLALGLFALWTGEGRGRWARRAVVAGVLLALVASAVSHRFAERHRKDDYRTAAEQAVSALAQGQQVWWAADFIGAVYYRVPGTFDVMGELTGDHQPPSCADLPGAQAAANLEAACLQGLSRPDLVVLARPETFDRTGAITAYLTTGGYVRVEELPAIDIWRSSSPPAADIFRSSSPPATTAGAASEAGGR